MYINREGIQFSRRDTFDYSTLGDLMIAWMKKFKEHSKMGCPHVYLEKVAGVKEFYTDNDIEAGIQEMNKDIDRLIWALGDDNSPELLDLPYEEWIPLQEKYEKEREEKLKLFAKLYQLLWR